MTQFVPRDPGRARELREAADMGDLVGGMLSVVLGAVLFFGLLEYNTNPNARVKTLAEVKADFTEMHRKIAAGPTGAINATHWTDVFKFYRQPFMM